MKGSRLLSLLYLVLPLEVYSRTWKNVVPKDVLESPDVFDMASLTSEVVPFGSPEPTSGPATDPPTKAPTSSPAAHSTPGPSLSPSVIPTAPPSIVAQLPTQSPTADPYPVIAPPLFPDPWYFNYDTRPGSLYGPGNQALVVVNGAFQNGFKNNKWANKVVSPDYYWKEFTNDANGTWKGVLQDFKPLVNRCGNVGAQSPIDVRDNGLGKCEEHHEVRSLPGDFRLSGDKVSKEIQSNKLRLSYERRPCQWLDLPECQEPDPPKADFPHGWGGFADVVNIDFKVPSEHLLNGTRYDAEFQIFHIHKHRKRMPTVTTLIEATEDGFNWYFDEALKAFDFKFQRDAILCAMKRRRSRRLVQDFQKELGLGDSNGNSTDYNTWGEYSLENDEPEYEKRQKKIERELQLQSGVWDPHHPLLVPSIHFYRYEGSLTEPPCGEWVSWFVTDVTMKISFDQLDHLKKIIFTHVDPNCTSTSVHYNQSVARPIQDTAGRSVYLCTPKDFVADPPK